VGFIPAHGNLSLTFLTAYTATKLSVLTLIAVTGKIFNIRIGLSGGTSSWNFMVKIPELPRKRETVTNLLLVDVVT